MTGELVILPDATAVARAVATHFVQTAQAAIQLHGRFNVALAGGTTPRQTYELLGSHEFAWQVSWRQVHLFWGDERCVPPDHPDSNFRLAEEILLGRIPLPAGNIHRILSENDPLVAAETYEQDLKDHFATAMPRFDLVLLGVGADGHIASIFPGTAALTEAKRLVVAVQHPQTNRWRVTLTLPVINNAAHVDFLACGTTKAGIMAQLHRPAPSGAGPLPAQLVQPASGQIRWFVDHAAAEHLSG